MSREQGSVLAGVLGLGLVMTLAAASYLNLTGNAGKNDQWAHEEARLRNAAESGIHLGVRWIRTHDSADFSSDLLAPNLPITMSADRFVDIEGFRVRVRLLRNPGFRTLEALATRGTGRDTCRITWQVDSIKVTTVVGFSNLLSDVYLSKWWEQYLPAVGGP